MRWAGKLSNNDIEKMSHVAEEIPKRIIITV